MRKLTILFMLSITLLISARPMKSVDAKVIDLPRFFHVAAESCIQAYYDEASTRHYSEQIDSIEFTVDIIPWDSIFVIRYQLEFIPLMDSYKYCYKSKDYTIYSNNDYFEKFVVSDSFVTIVYESYEYQCPPIYDPPYWSIRVDSLP